MRIDADALKIKEETKYAEKSSFRPFSSATYLATVCESPKSEAIWMKDRMSVNAVRVPMSSWVIALARNASPKTPINVERMFRIVKYMDPVATLEASSASHTFLKHGLLLCLFWDSF